MCHNNFIYYFGFGLLISSSYSFCHELNRGSTCIGEEVYFYIRQGDIDNKRTPSDPGYEDAVTVKYTTTDGATLGGLMLKAKHTERHKEKQFMLIALGNAMRVDDYYKNFNSLTELGIDVYIFDYRGFGRSNGKSVLSDQAIDFLELFEYIHDDYDKSYIYGISHGAAIALNALHDKSKEYNALIIDSMPSKIPFTLCLSDDYDPMNFYKEVTVPMLIIAGGRDSEVPLNQQEDFIHATISNMKNACLLFDKNIGHPFSKASNLDEKIRINGIKGFINSVANDLDSCDQRILHGK